VEEFLNSSIHAVPKPLEAKQYSTNVISSSKTKFLETKITISDPAISIAITSNQEFQAKVRRILVDSSVKLGRNGTDASSKNSDRTAVVGVDNDTG